MHKIMAGIVVHQVGSGVCPTDHSGLIIQICLNVLIINNYIFLKKKGHGLASVQYLHVSRPVVEIIC